MSDLIKNESICVDDNTGEILHQTMTRESPEFDESSPQFLLWQQQKHQLSLTDNRSMTWHPLVIRWCLSIYLKSPGTYQHIRQTKFLSLPCKNTLLNYVNFTDPGCGFNKDIVRRLIETCNFQDSKEYERNVSLIFDEMKIKSGLVFSKTTGKLVGLVEMGDMNDAFESFKAKCEKDHNDEVPLAKYVIAFMVRGICSSLQYVFGHFASEGMLTFRTWHRDILLSLFTLSS